jgi:hypothetical protein
MSNWNSFRGELREIAWLASAIGDLSVLGVALAVTLVLTLDSSWASWISASVARM